MQISVVDVYLVTRLRRVSRGEKRAILQYWGGRIGEDANDVGDEYLAERESRLETTEYRDVGTINVYSDGAWAIRR